ncbi:MAG: hypothetical protein ACJ77E_14295 [Gaiellaceae bacterium]
MSVGTRRFAAAQRTAARKAPSRAKRLGAWIIIVPAISLFSFSIVASAAGLRSKPDVASAAAKIVQDKQDKQGRSDDKSDDGGFVVVDTGDGGEGFAKLLTRGAKEVCWISTSGLGRVSAVYRTTTSTVHVGGTTYSLVTVYGANTHTLRLLLGTTAVECKLVQSEHLFFLPFDPNLS